MKIFVVPKKGVLVRMPSNRMHIPENGMMVTNDTYINRRISDGDLVIKKQDKIKPAKKKSGDE